MRKSRILRALNKIKSLGISKTGGIPIKNKKSGSGSMNMVELVEIKEET